MVARSHWGSAARSLPSSLWRCRMAGFGSAVVGVRVRSSDHVIRDVLSIAPYFTWLACSSPDRLRSRHHRGKCADRVGNRRGERTDAEHLEPAPYPAETGDDRPRGSDREQRRESQCNRDREARIVGEGSEVSDERDHTGRDETEDRGRSMTRGLASRGAFLGLRVRPTGEEVARPIEKPSARRFAKPRMRMIRSGRSAPTTPETTAKVVMMPSFAPYTRSGR